MSHPPSYTTNKAGLPPGALVHVSKLPLQTGQITVSAYDAEGCNTINIQQFSDILPYRQKKRRLWVQCEGLDIVDMVQALGSELEVHPLVLEDILNTHQRPKFEEYDNYLYFVIKILRVNKDLSITHEQISLLLFADMVFTFREQADELFAGIRQRLDNPNGRFRTLGSDYLAYAIIDLVVDHYFVLTDTLEDIIENIELELLARPQAHLFSTIAQLKKELVFLRRAITPMREVMLSIQRCESSLLNKKTHPYFRDVFDHCLRVMDTLDTYRDFINGLLDIYLSSVSNRMNEIMKVMTVFATIFIPLTFLVGVYGMNFEYMPELHWKWGYFTLWGLFFCIPAGLLYFFKRRHWL